MNWIYYLLEANLYLTIFYALYYLTLKNETYYQLNRAYLLFTSALAFLIPFLQLGILKPVYTTAAPAITLSIRPVMITLMAPVKHPAWSFEDYLLTAYISVSCLLVIHLAVKIYSLVRLSYKNRVIVNGSYKLIEIADGGNAFSFFNYLFISGDQPQKQTVINHELIHIQQKHSWDILYLQVFKIINWFNPIAYLLLHSIKEQHEFIADKEVATRVGDASVYAGFLVNNAYGLNESTLTNTFFNKNLLKKRIIMLHQKPSGNLARLKYLAALPVCAGLLCASTLAFSKTYGWIDLAPKPKKDTTYTNKTEHNSDYVNINNFTNAKGYKIEEKTAAHNGNWSRKATITDKQGNLHIFYDEKITPADRKMLWETYGYQFPKPKVFNVKLSQPTPPIAPPNVSAVPPVKPKGIHSKKGVPPAPPALIAPPPPPQPAPPASAVPPAPSVSPGKASDKIAPPQSPNQNLNDSDKTALKKEKIGYQQAKEPEDFPLVFINGKKNLFKEKRKPGQQFFCSATDSLVRYQPGTALALKKWGGEAKNGVILLYGKDASIEIK